ncbi:MAG: hypothetical protein N3I35_02905 [Clostridia bacterium]|nr:hypothetical protein [Clostridia bacterium]
MLILLYNKVRKVLCEREKLHIENDFALEKCWEQLIEILSISEEETINCLEACHKYEILWISEVFEEVAYNLQSQKYIDCLKRLDKKYPELNITRSVEVAQSYILG